MYAVYASPPTDFAAEVGRILADPRGWAKHGHTFRMVSAPAAAHIRISLTPGQDMRRMFPQDALQNLNVCDMAKRHVYVHAERWDGSLPNASRLDLPLYRAYVVNHEVGHALGAHAHRTTCTTDGRTPVMMQQTLGTGGCTPSPWPSAEDAAQLPPLSGGGSLDAPLTPAYFGLA
jgi:hypothetical protein